MPYIVSGLALIAIWGVVTVLTAAPGWIHLLLTAGLALWIYGMVKPGARHPER
ncbi:MAG: hypothetical protein FJ363_03700 [Gemmatimonadetes bacterium]|nr:hypothetical protein [Gemmatimonadota bacterium]